MSEHLHELLKKNLKVFFKPIYSFLIRPDILEISISQVDEIWLKTESGMERAEAAFKEEKLKIAILNLLQLFGTELNEQQPHVKLMAPEGLQVDLWYTGDEKLPLLIFSKPRRSSSVSLTSLSREGVLSKIAQFFLQGLLDSRQTILVTGVPTEFRQRFFRALLRELSEHERKLFMPCSERPLQLPFALRLEHPETSKDELSPKRLRGFHSLQPARMLLEDLAESDTSEVMTLLLEGFRGSIISLEATNPRTAFHSLERRILQQTPLPFELVRQQIALTFPWIVHVSALPSGEYYISSIEEILPETSSKGYEFRPIFVFHAQHRAEGWFRTLKTTGYIPSCLKDFHLCGFHALQAQDFENQMDATILRRGKESRKDFLAAAQQLLASEERQSSLASLSEEIEKVSRPLSTIRRRLKAGELGLEEVQEQLDEAAAGKPVLKAPVPVSLPPAIGEEETLEEGQLSSVTAKQPAISEQKPVVEQQTPVSEQPAQGSSWPSMTRTGSFVFTQAVKQENEQMNLLLDEDREQVETDTLVKRKAIQWEEPPQALPVSMTSETAIRPASEIRPPVSRQDSDILSVSDMLPEDELRQVAQELRGTFTRDPSVNDTKLRESPKLRYHSTPEEDEQESLTLKTSTKSEQTREPVFVSSEHSGVFVERGMESQARLQALQQSEEHITSPPADSTAIPQRKPQDRSVLVRRGVRQTSSFPVDDLEPGDRTYVRARTPARVRNAVIPVQQPINKKTE